jgi:ABC-type enterochelin transport system permease subunit
MRCGQPNRLHYEWSPAQKILAIVVVLIAISAALVGAGNLLRGQ